MLFHPPGHCIRGERLRRACPRQCQRREPYAPCKKAAAASGTRSLLPRPKPKTREKIFRSKSPNDDSSSGERARTHSDDRVTEADVREEERQPARKGAEAALGAAEA